MKKITFITASLALLFAASCTNNPSSDTATTATAQTAAATTGKTLIADVAASNIHWRATHKGGAFPRFGTINITNGTLSLDGGKVTGGSFDVDINTLTVDTTSVTEPGKKAIDLQNHLKSPAFFDAAKFPTAKFVITKMVAFDSTKDKSLLVGANNIVSGNLTLKDSTINISFPAIITATDNGADVQAKFTVDRTSWGLNFKTEGDPANWLISKDFELDINLKASQK